METLLQAIGWYCLISVAVGCWVAASIRYSRWKHDTGRDLTYSPNKDKLGYLIAFIIGCPFLNLAALALLLWDRYNHARDTAGRKAWTK